MDPVRFTTSDGVSLEGELRSDGPVPRASAVICHPHPRHGGSKDHPILWAIRNELARRGCAVLSFNFRGVMGSAGTYGAGRTEVRDVAAAVDRVRQESVGPTVVAGWSFGANVALHEAIDDVRVGGLALVGFPLVPADIEIPAPPTPAEVRAMGRPVLFVTGEHDDYCPSRELLDYAEASGGWAEIIAGTDHYLWRHEREAAELIGRFMAERVIGDV